MRQSPIKTAILETELVNIQIIRENGTPEADNNRIKN